MKPPELNIDPVANPPSLKDSYVIKRSSPLAVLYIKSAGKMGTDEPPGTNAFNGRSELIPPRYSSEFMNS
jgi:hypothetical protein